MRLERKPVDGIMVILCCVIYLFGLLTIGTFLDRGVYGTILCDVLVMAVSVLVYHTSVEPYFDIKERDKTVNVLMAVLFIAFCCVSVFSVSYIQRLIELWPPKLFAGYKGMDAIFYSALTLFIAPIAEEFLFRGVLFSYFRRHFNFFLSSMFVSVVFGFLHGTQVQLYSCIALSLIACLVFDITSNINWCILVHAVMNVFMLFIQPILSVPGDLTVHLILTCVLNCVLLFIYIFLLAYVTRKRKKAS